MADGNLKAAGISNLVATINNYAFSSDPLANSADFPNLSAMINELTSSATQFNNANKNKPCGAVNKNSLKGLIEKYTNTLLALEQYKNNYSMNPNMNNDYNNALNLLYNHLQSDFLVLGTIDYYANTTFQEVVKNYQQMEENNNLRNDNNYGLRSMEYSVNRLNIQLANQAQNQNQFQNQNMFQGQNQFQNQTQFQGQELPSADTLRGFLWSFYCRSELCSGSESESVPEPDSVPGSGAPFS